MEARKEVERCHEAYTRSKTDQHKKSLKVAKSQLFQTYDKLREELQRKISEVEAVSEDSKHSEAWRIMNDISGRKKAKAGLVMMVLRQRIE